MTSSDATRRWQALDARHHLHPFTTHHELAAKGARIITRAEGCYVWDSEGNRLFDGMAGLWCTQVGHGRERLAQVAARADQHARLLQRLLPERHAARDRAGGEAGRRCCRTGWTGSCS